MYSVEITVEKDKLTGETKVLSSTTRLPKGNSVQGVKVYEDELKGMHWKGGSTDQGFLCPPAKFFHAPWNSDGVLSSMSH